MTSLAERLYDALHTVARHYQFRDHDDSVCHDLSPTQCYTLHELREHEQLTMRELSDRVGLDPSSMTRAIDGMVQLRLVQRQEDPADRRRCVISLTKAGRKKIEAIREACVQEAGMILDEIDQSSRRDVIRALEMIGDTLAQ